MLDKLAKIPQLIRLKRMAAAEKVEVEEEGIRVRVRGDQKIETIEIDGEDKKRLVNILNDALERAQKKAARKMAENIGDLSGLLK